MHCEDQTRVPLDPTLAEAQGLEDGSLLTGKPGRGYCSWIWGTIAITNGPIRVVCCMHALWFERLMDRFRCIITHVNVL